MIVTDIIAGLDPASAGETIHELATELYPICRSITGDGVRKSLGILRERIPLQLTEVPSGTRVFDWTVPKEWNIRDAYIKNSKGERVVDFQESNLHVVNYSTPIHEEMSLDELRPRLHSLPDTPDWIPYRTSYYEETWGFCLSQNVRDTLGEDRYEVCIDSTLEDGSLTYGEYVIDGKCPEEVLFSCHSCHPSLANDNLSGIAVACVLAGLLEGAALRHSYRFLFVPGTIGPIAWMSRNEEALKRIRHGLVLSNAGDPGQIHYKRSRRGNADIDLVVRHVLERSGQEHRILDFSPYGYDERQYCSPGINLPVGRLSRTPYREYAEYHTSADNLDLITPEALGDSLLTILSICEILEKNGRFENLCPKGEPQLGRRGLYRAVGGAVDGQSFEMAMLWILNLSDGGHSLLEIADRSDIAFSSIAEAADALVEHGLLAPLDDAR